MNILFYYVDTESSSGLYTGLGIASLSGYLKKYNHITDLIYYRSKSDLEYGLKKIHDTSPTIIGFYSTSVGFNTVKDISYHIRKVYPHIYQIYGGIHTTLNPESIYDISTIDAICVGYGEVPMLRFVEKIENGSDNCNIEGLWIRPSQNQISIIVKNSAYFPDIPPVEFLNFDYDIYLNEFKRFTDYDLTSFKLEVIFNRTCPFKCTFCSNQNLIKILGNKNFIPSPEESISFLEKTLYKFRINYIKIHDDIITMNNKWFRSFVSLYAEKIGIPFTCNLRAGTFNDEDIKLLKKANVAKVWIGLESGNEFIRNVIMNKNISNVQLRKSMEILKKNDLNVFTQNIIGVPFESPKRFIDTIKLNAELNPAHSYLSVFYPYPKTKLHKLCLHENIKFLKQSDDFKEREEAILDLPEFSPNKVHFYFKNFQKLINYQKRRNKNKMKYFLPLKSWSARFISILQK